MLKVAEKHPAKKSPSTTFNIRVSNEEVIRMRAWVDERMSRAKSGPYPEVVTITPALAKVLLESNDANRPVSNINLERIKRDMIKGHWHFNGEPIIVSADGHLNDGQHRLLAIAQTGVSQRMIVVFGTSRESRMTLDIGVVRTVGHFLGMSGHADANALSAVANYVWQYKQNGRLSTSGSDRPTKTEAQLVIEHYRDIPDSLKFVSRTGVGAICSRTMLAFCHWAISQKAMSGVDAFFDRLIVGTGLSAGEPLLYCRNRLMAMRGGRHGNVQDRAELIFRAWNAHRNGERVERIALSGRKLPEIER